MNVARRNRRRPPYRSPSGSAPVGRDSADDLPHRLHDAYDEIDRTHRSLLFAWLAFGVTFGLLRALTYAIHEGVGPFGDITVGGAHIHHYVWGIALLMGVGLVSLIVDTPRYNPWLGIAFGAGCALVLDEYALLLNLRDVYWANEGRVSVDVTIGALTALGVYLSASTFWRRATHEIADALLRLEGRRGPR